MAINPNITSFQHSEGEVKDFGPNDQRKLTSTAGGVKRWISTKSSDTENTNQNVSGDNSQIQQAQNIPSIKLSPAQVKNLEANIKDNPFLSCITLQDIDQVWFEEMLKIKSDKEWYEDEIIGLQNKLKLSSGNTASLGLRKNIDRFQKVIDSETREEMLNLQRISYEYFRLINTIESIKNIEPAFDFKSFKGNLTKLEDYLKKLKDA